MKYMGVTGLQRKHMDRLGSANKEKGKKRPNRRKYEGSGENLVNMKDLGVLRRYLAGEYDAALGR